MTQHAELIERLRYVPTASQFMKISDLVSTLVGEREAAAHAIEALKREAEGLRKDAERYRWLRYADNDEKVLRHYRSRRAQPGGPTMYLPREVHFDDAIDAAIQHEGASNAGS